MHHVRLHSTDESIAEFDGAVPRQGDNLELGDVKYSVSFVRWSVANNKSTAHVLVTPLQRR
jgi:hypothetical protein